MEKINVINLLVGPSEGFDEVDTGCLIFYGCSKFGGDVQLDFNSGILEVLDGGGNVKQQFRLKLTIE